MERLSGFSFTLLPADAGPAPEGAVQATAGAVTVRVDWRTPAYQTALGTVLYGTILMVVIGTAVFAIIAWRLATVLARPVEDLAAAARRIGSGNLSSPVDTTAGGEVAALARDFESMRQRLQQLDRDNRKSERLATLGTFTATIAHEVRNPLSAVKLTMQMLASRHPDDPALPMVLDELARLDMTVDELLGYARGMTVEPVPCDLDGVAAEVVRLLKRQGDHADVELAISGNARVWADPRRCTQLLLNLILNGIQAQHETGGSVLVDLVADGFSVCDRGPGVAAELRDQLFEAFTSDKAHGTGLGLHLARLVVEAHGGRIRCEDREGGGSCFVVSGLRPAPAH
jgi:two-component system sensor histidine kinase AtoS